VYHPSTPIAPQTEQASILGHFSLGGGDWSLLRAMTKKGHQLFFEKKVHSRQNPDYAYADWIISNLAAPFVFGSLFAVCSWPASQLWLLVYMYTVFRKKVIYLFFIYFSQYFLLIL